MSTKEEEIACQKMKWYLSMYISLQKSSMFSGVRSCSRNTLIATSVPFHMPRKTSPKKPKMEKMIDSSKNTKSIVRILIEFKINNNTL